MSASWARLVRGTNGSRTSYAGRNGRASAAPRSLPRLPTATARDTLVVLAVSALVTTALLWPLAARAGTVARDDADGRYSVWNVAWVAHALTTDPRHLFDANIFYPHRGTLAYSEQNVIAGLLAVPVWLATHNAYAAHNIVVLVAFALAAAGMFFLALYHVGDRPAAAVSAVCFAFCPYVFAHLAHIQLLMTAGLPFAMLAFHRLADSPSPRRGIALGVAIGIQILACGYYGVFVTLAIAFAALVTAALRPLWRTTRYWTGLLIAAGISGAVALAQFVVYAPVARGLHADA